MSLESMSSLQPNPAKKSILSVEDDDATFHTLTVALEEVGLPVTLYRALDSEDALDFLHQRGAYMDARRRP